jgi:hypothetical protein
MPMVYSSQINLYYCFIGCRGGDHLTSNKGIFIMNKAQAMVNAFDLFDYENLDCSGRDELIADLVAILWPDLKDESMVPPLMDYIQNLFDDRLAIIEQTCHNPRFESRTFN